MLSSAAEYTEKNEESAVRFKTTGPVKTQRVFFFGERQHRPSNQPTPRYEQQQAITKSVHRSDQRISFSSQTNKGEQAEKQSHQKMSPKDIQARDLDNMSLVGFGNHEFPHRKTISKKRGPYRKYSANLRREAIKLCQELSNPAKAASILDIPIKNLRRWLVTGPQRKVGGILTRRKTISRPRHGGRAYTVGGGVHRNSQNSSKSLRRQREGHGTFEVGRQL